MPSQARTSAGSTIEIAPAPVTYDQAGFELLTFTEIGEVSNIGDFGKTYNLVTFNPLGDRKTVKRKGSYNNGTLDLEMARVPSDAGQTILIQARDSDDSYAFCVTLQDGTKNYFTGQVMGYNVQVGGVDDITMATMSVEIDDDVISV